MLKCLIDLYYASQKVKRKIEMNFVDNKEIEDTNHLDMPIFYFLI